MYPSGKNSDKLVKWVDEDEVHDVGEVGYNSGHPRKNIIIHNFEVRFRGSWSTA